MQTYTHIHKQTNTYAQLQILFTQTRTHTDTFTQEHIKKISDQSILKRKIVLSKNIFTHNNTHILIHADTNKCTHTYTKAHILYTQMHALFHRHK